MPPVHSVHTNRCIVRDEGPMSPVLLASLNSCDSPSCTGLTICSPLVFFKSFFHSFIQRFKVQVIKCICLNAAGNVEWIDHFVF
jgi:hypothetical protein